jgi:LPPG:FO 2-phospho-L-lactate transferase
MNGDARYVVLSGGVGGARFAAGLVRWLGPAAGQLAIIANTGDDFEHLGLAISPDLDTLMYTLAGCVNTETGWGCRDETWSFMDALGSLGGETWFRLGDRDLATHVERTRRLHGGESLTAVTAQLCARLGIAAQLLPMSDARVRTMLDTDEGTLAFQDYFVRRQAMPRVQAIRYEGAAQAPPAAAIAALLTDPSLAAVFIAPSNPLLSIGPILAVPSISAAIRSTTAPVVAISPIVAGRALRGPAAKLLTELGEHPSATAVASRYRDLLDGFVFDEQDAAEAAALTLPGVTALTAQTVMRDIEDQARLAEAAVAFAARLRGARS